MEFVTRPQQRWVARLLVLLLLALPATQGGSVYAADPPPYKAGEWEITVEVQNSQILAFWIGRVWEYTGTEGELLAQRRVEITQDCEIFGAPTFGTSDVTFDGVDDYITCLVPNFPALFATMAPELANCRCRFESPPYAAADISPLYAKKAQPVVYHNRLHLDVIHVDTQSVRFPFIRTSAEGIKPMGGGGAASGLLRQPVRVDANNSLALAQLTLHFNGGESLSWQSNLSNAWQQNGFQIWAGYNAARFAANTSKTGWAKFLAESGFWDVVMPEYVDGFFMWESATLPKYESEPMPSGFGLAAQTLVYIGHNPDTGDFFDGTMRTVVVDPGCRGH